MDGLLIIGLVIWNTKAEAKTTKMYSGMVDAK